MNQTHFLKVISFPNVVHYYCNIIFQCNEYLVNTVEICHTLLQQSVNQQILLGMGSANERQCYNVMSSLTGWTHTQNDLWSMHDQCISRNSMVSHSWWPQYKFLFLQQYMGNPLLSPRSKTLLCHGTNTNLKSSSNRNWTMFDIMKHTCNIQRSHQIDEIFVCCMYVWYRSIRSWHEVHWNTILFTFK